MTTPQIPVQDNVNGTSVAGLLNIVANNAAVQINDEANIVSLQSQVATLAAMLGNPPSGAYTAPTASNYFMYSGNASAWTTATKNGSTLVFGSPYNSQYVTTSSYNSIIKSWNIPTIVALPWDYVSKSMIFSYVISSVLVQDINGTISNTTYNNTRRIALDSNNSPTIYTADVSVPYVANYVYSAQGAAIPYQSLISGVATSSTQFKSIGFSHAIAVGPANFACISKYTFGWDGTSFTVSQDGYSNGGNTLYTSNYMSTANGYTLSYNYNGCLVNGNGWLSVGTYNSDVTTLDAGITMNTAFANQRLNSPPGLHDFAGNGYVIIPYTTTTVNDGTSRLTIMLQQHDAINGILNTASYRITQKTFSSILSIKSFSNTLFFVQWIDTTSNRWAAVLTYNPTTNVLTLYNNTIYNSGQLGTIQLGGYGFATFSNTVLYGLFKTGGTQNASLCQVTFNTANVGTELTSPSASNIVLTLCSGLVSVTSVIISGMIQMAPNVIIVYGIVTAGGVTNCFVDSFTLS